MGSRSTNAGERKQYRVKEDQRSDEPKQIKVRKTSESKQKSVLQQLVLNKNKRVRVIGSVTGKEYVFEGAGAIVEVDEQDVPAMLEKGKGVSCCSGTEGAPYFSLIN